MSRTLKLCAAATLATLCAAPAMAQSSVTVSGKIDLSVNSTNAGGARTTALNNGDMQTSYIQFSGSEDLGGGLKAEFALGSFIRADVGAAGRFTGDTMWSRDANLALSGSFGKVTLGRQISPLYLSTIIFNPLGSSFNFSPISRHTFNAFAAGTFGVGNVVSADSGYSNAISYSTPNFNGLSATALYSLSETSGVAGSFSGNVLYFNGPFAATLAYENTTSNASNTFTGFYPAGSVQKVTQLGAMYNFNVVKAFAQYQRNQNPAATFNTYQLGVSAPAGAGSVLASYARTGSTIDQKTFTVGYDYNLSKRTDLYTLYMSDKAAAYANTVSSFSVGVRHAF